MIDKYTEQRVKLLHPDVIAEVLQGAEEFSEQGIIFRIIEGLRTDAIQNAYYFQDKLPLNQVNQLRQQAGLPIFKDAAQLVLASNAKAGQSAHSYGLGFDFCLVHNDGSISFNMTEDMNADKKSDWMSVVNWFVAKGWTWGHAFHDNDHLEKMFKFTYQQLWEKKQAGQVDTNGYVILT